MRPEKIRAFCSADEPLDQTVSLVKAAMEEEPFLDVQMANLVLGRMEEPALNHRDAIRALEILDLVSPGTRVARMIGRLLQHDNPLLRSKAAMVVSRRIEGMAWIEAHLQQADPRVRANILQALWESSHPECTAVFAQYRDDADNRVAGNALYGLYLRGEPDAIPGVVGMASHADPRFRATAAWLMGRIGGPEFLNVLRRLVKDDSGPVKGTALKALVQIKRSAGLSGDACAQPSVPT